MRAVALLFLFFGPVLAVPAAAGLWTWRQLGAAPDARIYGLAAGTAAAVVVFGLLRRHGLLREVAFVALTVFWTGWLWFTLTEPGYDWTRPPALHAPNGLERMALMLIVLVYLTLCIVAEEARPRRVS